MVFGLAGPLLYLGIGGLLFLWGRALTRAGKGTAAKVGWTSAILGVLSFLIGGFGTALLLVHAFDDVGSTPVESRSAALADGIAGAMSALAIGMGGSLLLYVVSVGANLFAISRPKAPPSSTPQTTTPPP